MAIVIDTKLVMKINIAIAVAIAIVIDMKLMMEIDIAVAIAILIAIVDYGN